MSYAGRFLKGDTVPISFVTQDASEVVSNPSQAPTLNIYRGATLVKTLKVPAVDAVQFPGLFVYEVFLGGAFDTAGIYEAHAEWIISGSTFGEVITFEVLAAGDTSGMGNTMTYHEMPFGDYAVVHHEDGNIHKYRNPTPL